MERWLAVVGYEGLYEVSDLGRVRSIHHKASGVLRVRATPKILAQTSSGRHTDHLTVQLSDGNSKRRNRFVHALVLRAFRGEPPTPAHRGAHDDGEPVNNKLVNLFWKTMQENMDDRERHGRTAKGESHGKAVLTEADVRAIRASESSDAELAVIYPVTEKYIGVIRRGETWRHI